MPRTVAETTSFYELPSVAALRPPARAPAPEPWFVRVESPCPPLNRMLYAAVGAGWWWVDRLSWTPDKWLDVLSAPGYETWVAYLAGAPCAYVELSAPTDTRRWDTAHPSHVPRSPTCSPSVWHTRRGESGGSDRSPHPAVETKIEYCGVMPAHLGRGIGGWLLTRAVQRAFARGSTRVLLNTSSLDHAAARANYEARGFVLRGQETADKVLPDTPPGEFGV